MSTHAPHTPRHKTSRAPGSPEALYGSWTDRSACRDQPAQLWDWDAPSEAQETARGICLGCPVFAECLSDARATEGGSDVGRSNVRAALTGRDRDWLNRQVRIRGGFDAEEARLLALEARVSGRPVGEIAEREGVVGTTRGLAERLLRAEDKPKVPVVPVAVESPLRKAAMVLDRIEDVLEWRADGMSMAEVASRLGVSRRIASEVLKDYTGQDPDKPLRARGRFRKVERAEQVIVFRQLGMTWKDIDRHLEQAYGTTYRFVARYRGELEERGEVVPREFQRDQALLSEAQVVRIRERAAEGATDLEQAMELGVARKTVTDVASGESYKRYGGPIRPKRENRPSVASRTLWHNVQAGFVKAS